MLHLVHKNRNSNAIETSHPTEIPNALNTYFFNIAENVRNTVPKTPKSPLDNLIQKNPKSMFIHPVPQIEVEDTISSFDSIKSVGPNSILVNFLKILGCYCSCC